MQINPKLTEQIVKVSADVKNLVTEEVSKSEAMERVQAKLPTMSLESVMPKKNIVKTAEKAIESFDVDKAIEEFSDIHDVKTIEKICKRWEHDLTGITKKFVEDTIPQEKVYEEHRKSIDELAKYEKFAVKLSDIMEKANVDPEECLRAFSQYIEPHIMSTQATLRVIDNLPKVKKAYSVVSSSTQTNEINSKNIGSFIESMTDLNPASKVIAKLEKQRANMPEEEFNRLSKMVEEKLIQISS